MKQVSPQSADFGSITKPWTEKFQNFTNFHVDHCQNPTAEYLQSEPTSIAENYVDQSTAQEYLFEIRDEYSGGLLCLPGCLPLSPLASLIEAFDLNDFSLAVICDQSSKRVFGLVSKCTLLLKELKQVFGTAEQCLTAIQIELIVSQLAHACGRPSCFKGVGQIPISSYQVAGEFHGVNQSIFETNDQWYEELTQMQQHAFLCFDPLQAPRVARFLPLGYYLNEPCILGAYGRLMRDPTCRVESRLEGKHAKPFSLQDIDVIAVTTDRWRSVYELLKSIRRFIGDQVAITIVVQSPRTIKWALLAKRFDATFIHVDFDTGLSACRNIAVEATNRSLVWLMDDDFQIDERCRTNEVLQILAQDKRWDVVGGNLLDAVTWKTARQDEVSQGFAMKLISGPPEVLWVRLEDLPRTRDFINPITYTEECHIVDNFALFRRDTTFAKGIRWNPQLKINAEHQDLYLTIAATGEIKIVRTNALKVRNVRVQSRRFRQLRNRNHQFFNFFFQHQAMRSFIILGGWSRTMSANGWLGSRQLDSPWGHKPDYTIVPSEKL